MTNWPDIPPSLKWIKIKIIENLFSKHVDAVCSAGALKVSRSLLDHLTQVVGLLLVVAVIHFTTDRQRSTTAARHGRRYKPYCSHHGSVRWTASAAAALASVYCDSSYPHRMTSCRCPSTGNRRSISWLFQRLLQRAVIVRRRHKVIAHHLHPP